MLDFLKYIFQNKKIYFLYPEQNIDILVFGRVNLNLNFGKKIKIFELNDQVYIPIFLKSIIIFLKDASYSLKELYFKELVKSFSPAIGIGDEINKNIFKFKKFFPNKLAIGYQIVNRSNLTGNNTEQKKKLDYFLIFNKKAKKYYKDIDAKFLISGSLKNNEKPLKNKKKIFDIMFISEFRPKVFEKIKAENDKKNKLIQGIKENFYNHIESVLGVIDSVVKEKKLKICIALASNRTEKKKQNFMQKEINFFSNKIKNISLPNDNSYELADKSHLVISMWSTLGAELFAQNKKVLFLAPKFHKSIYWDFFPRKNGFNWQQDLKKKEIKEKIIKLLNINEKNWEKTLKVSKYGILFDKKNKLLKNIVTKKLNGIN